MKKKCTFVSRVFELHLHGVRKPKITLQALSQAGASTRVQPTTFCRLAGLLPTWNNSIIQARFEPKASTSDSKSTTNYLAKEAPAKCNKERNVLPELTMTWVMASLNLEKYICMFWDATSSVNLWKCQTHMIRMPCSLSGNSCTYFTW